MLVRSPITANPNSGVILSDSSPDNWRDALRRVPCPGSARASSANRTDSSRGERAVFGGTPSVRAGLALAPETGVLPRVNAREFENSRGLQLRTACAIARMCSGVVPQQPPTRFNQPFSAHLATLGANVSGVSGKPVSDNGSGKPAFGYALIK